MKLTLKKGPLYIQLQDILRERIISGHYPKNTLIPPELELKEEFGVSIITVRKAVEQLAQQGYVEKRSGIGTTVLDNNAVSKLSKGQRFSEYLLDEGHKLSKEFVHLSSINVTKHVVLVDLFNKRCHCVERFYKLNNETNIYFKQNVSKHIIITNDFDHLQKS